MSLTKRHLEDFEAREKDKIKARYKRIKELEEELKIAQLKVTELFIKLNEIENESNKTDDDTTRIR